MMLRQMEEIVLILIIMTVSSIKSDGVTLITKYSGTYITLTCQADSHEVRLFMIHLSCPLVESGFCYSNCTPHCSMNSLGKCVPSQNLNAISRCEHKILDWNSVSTSYQIRASDVHISGLWKCSFKNYKSNVVPLAKYEPPSSTTEELGETVPVLIKHVTPDQNHLNNRISQSSTRSVISIEKKQPSRKNPKLINEPNFLDYMTRPELVLVLILLLGISLLLNLSFLIRCVLLKSVIENYYRGIQNSQCILECLCLDLVSNKYLHRRYSRSLNLSNQVGSDFYRCQPMCTDNMAIYDDLSAVSNGSARMKMRSNHSSEMDEESRLTNLMPNGGCHVNPLGIGSVSNSLNRRYTNPSHAAYFHPGLGNYVIVSGPVASHDQYSIPTAASGYALQMVSPIPSAPGSIVGGPGTHHSASSANSDESDNDSRTALSTSMNTGLPYRTCRINSQPIDFRESTKLMELSHNFVVPLNGLDHSLHYHQENSKAFARSNGSVPLHPWPKENVVPTTSSISSLPYYTVSENGASNQELRNKNTSEKLPSPPKDLPVMES